MTSINRQESFDTLLRLCAVLQWFDVHLLSLLKSYDEKVIARLLNSDYVVAVKAPHRAWRLRSDLKNKHLTELRRFSPNEELKLQELGFRVFLAAATSNPNDPSWTEAAESACFYHLQQLYYLLYQKQEWQQIQAFVYVARKSRPRHPYHRQRLNLYEAYALLHLSEYQQAEKIFQTLVVNVDLEPYTELRVLNGLAMVAMYRTDHDRALHWLQKLHHVARKANDRTYQGIAHINQSTVYMDLNYFDDALDQASRALNHYYAVEDGPLQMLAYLNRGNALLHLGRWQDAASQLETAANLADRLDLRMRSSNVYWAQGLLFHMTSQLTQSETAYKRALAISRSDETGNPRIESDTLWYLGFLYHTQRRDEEALAAYDEALTLAQSLNRPHWQSLINYRRGDIFQRQGKVRTAQDAYENAIQLIEQLRGDSETEQVKLGLLDSTQQLYEAMVLLCIETGQKEAAFQYVERARSQSFLDQLRRKDPTLYNSFGQPAVTLDELQSALPEDTVLLEYFATGIVPHGDGLVKNLPARSRWLRNYLVQPPRLFLFAITRTSFQLHALPLNPTRLQSTEDTLSPSRGLLRPRQLSYLYKQLIEPVEALVDSHKMLYIVPHGPLHHVPWMALKADDGRYLLSEDGPAIALAPSATILLRNCLSRPSKTTGAFLSVGYNGEGDSCLQYAELEASLLAKRMTGTAWTGEEPKLARLKEVGASTRWLHFSGHAQFHANQPLASQLLLAADEQLTALELMAHLNVSADVVTLSACTSGVNQIAAGDELMGLPRAFLYAGSPTVVCTGWEAADLVALLVMEKFYEELSHGTAPANALRNAQVTVRTMTGSDLQARMERWRHQLPELAKTLPSLTFHDSEELLFADPRHWALFSVVGRGT